MLKEAFDSEQFLAIGTARLKFAFFDLVPAVMEEFSKLLAEPEEYRRLWTFDYHETGDPDDGLIQRFGEKNFNPNLPVYDRKSFLHFRPRLRRLLDERGVDYRRHERLLDLCEELYWRNYEAAIAAGRTLEVHFPDADIVARMSQADEHVLRLLSYEPADKEGDVTGKPHTDRGTFITIHLAQSQPGCEINGELIETEPDNALAFASDAFEHLTEGKVKAVLHRVVMKAKGDQLMPRWAIVFFSKYYNV